MTAQHIKPTRWAIAALIAVFGLIGATACSSSSKDTGSPGQPGKPGTPAAQTPWQQILAEVKPNGSVDVSTALTAFALAIGPVPGVTAPAGDRKDITSGTVAIRWVTRVWSKLSTAQKQAVQNMLNGSARPGTGTHSIRAAAAPPKPLPLDPKGPNVPCTSGDSDGASPYRALVDDTVDKISAHLGRQLKLKISIAVDTKSLDKGYMYTYGCSGKNVANGKSSGCAFHVTPEANLYPTNSPDTASALAHEVMHCFVIDRIGKARESNLPDWFGEGMPNWVGSALGRVGGVIGGWWREYLNTATTPLSQRTYDGIGFFVHLAETGTDPWNVIDKMTDAMANGGGTTAGWNAAGASSTAFLDSWGSGYVQGAGGMTSRAWTTTGPGLSTYRPNIDTAPGGEVANGKSLTIDSPAQATWPVTAGVSAEIVTVKPGSASGRISLGGGRDATLAAAAGATYCTLGSSECKCPEGSPGEGTTFTPMEKGLQYVTPTGGLSRAAVSVVGQSLDDFCKAKKSPLIGTWRAMSTTILAGHPGVANYRTTGGAGYTVTISSKGQLTINYAGMDRPSYTVVYTSGGLTAHASVEVSGTDTATVDLKTAGVWTPTNLKVGLRETAHFDGSGAMAGAGNFAGPIITGRWTIAGKTLTIVGTGKYAGRGSTWVFTKVK